MEERLIGYHDIISCIHNVQDLCKNRNNIHEYKIQYELECLRNLFSINSTLENMKFNKFRICIAFLNQAMQNLIYPKTIQYIDDMIKQDIKLSQSRNKCFNIDEILSCVSYIEDVINNYIFNDEPNDKFIKSILVRANENDFIFGILNIDYTEFEDEVYNCPDIIFDKSKESLGYELEMYKSDFSGLSEYSLIKLKSYFDNIRKIVQNKSNMGLDNINDYSAPLKTIFTVIEKELKDLILNYEIKDLYKNNKYFYKNNKFELTLGNMLHYIKNNCNNPKSIFKYFGFTIISEYGQFKISTDFIINKLLDNIKLINGIRHTENYDTEKYELLLDDIHQINILLLISDYNLKLKGKIVKTEKQSLIFDIESSRIVFFKYKFIPDFII